MTNNIIIELQKLIQQQSNLQAQLAHLEEEAIACDNWYKRTGDIQYLDKYRVVRDECKKYRAELNKVNAKIRYRQGRVNQ